MQWEWTVIWKIWRLALLRREDFAMSKNTRRWGIGWLGSYIGIEGTRQFSWCLKMEVPGT